MMLFPSFLKSTIRQRLTFIFAASAILILLCAGYFIYSFSASFRKNEFKLRLENRLEEVQEIMRRNPEGDLPAFSKYDEAVLPREQLWMLRPGDSSVLTGAEGKLFPLAEIMPRPKTGVIHQRLDRRDFAILYDSVIERVFVVSAIDVYGYTKMNNLQRVILVCLSCSVILLAFVSWYWTRRMLSPIANKIKKAQQIGTSSLNLRLEVKNPDDELGMLGKTFNDMLDRLEQGFKAQQQFIGNASHELRTPLTILRTEAEWALARPRTDIEYRQVLAKVEEKSLYLTNLVNQLLILARIHGPAAAKDMQNFRLDELLLQTVEEANSGAIATGIISCEIDTDALQEYLMQGDAAMIQTAIANLLENALKYGQGSPVQVNLRKEGSVYRLAVHDQGIGINEADRAQIFDPFFRSAVARALASGTGLGMPLSKAIAQWHGGSLQLVSQQKGTTFQLDLPLPK